MESRRESIEEKGRADAGEARADAETQPGEEVFLRSLGWGVREPSALEIDESDSDGYGAYDYDDYDEPYPEPGF